MVEIPAALFYVATIALVVVCGALTIMLFYLAAVLRIVLSAAAFFEKEGKKAIARAKSVRQSLLFIFDLFRD